VFGYSSPGTASIIFVAAYYFLAPLFNHALWRTRIHQRIEVQAVEMAAKYSFRVARHAMNMVSITEVGMLVRKGGFSLALTIGMMEIQSIMPPAIST